MEDYTKTNGLALNGAKTQVMVGSKGKPTSTFTHQRRRNRGQHL
jgi:hypothetical protein